MTTSIGHSLVILLAMSSGLAHAQTAVPGGTAGAPAGVILSEGVPVDPDAPVGTRSNGEHYVHGTYKDWDINCIHLTDRDDTCEMYQLLLDDAGTPTAEITLFPVEDPKFAAGAQVTTPLETSLLAGVTLQIDEGLPNQYPFQVCNPNGCVAIIGLLAEQLDDMKAGAEAMITIAHFRAQQTRVQVKVSLAGFTNAFKTLVDLQSAPTK